MCGIAGFFHTARGRQAARSELEPMVESIVHRGPDSAGYFCEDGIALGMRRLRIIDLEGGEQPMFDAHRNIVADLQWRDLQSRRVATRSRAARPSVQDPVGHRSPGLHVPRVRSGHVPAPERDVRDCASPTCRGGALCLPATASGSSRSSLPNATGPGCGGARSSACSRIRRSKPRGRSSRICPTTCS